MDGQETNAGQDRNPLEVRPAQDVVERLFLMVQVLRTHGEDHTLTQESVDSLVKALMGTRRPLSLQFIGQAVFQDRQLLPFRSKGLQQAREVQLALVNLSVHEISFGDKPAPEDLLRFGAALGQGMEGVSSALTELELEGISWQPLPGPKVGMELAMANPEVFVAGQITLAIDEADILSSRLGDPWDGVRGMSLVRRLQRCHQVSSLAAQRELEIAPRQWSQARRAVSAVFRTLCALSTLDADPSMARTVAHCVLACCCHGLQERGGRSMGSAADSAFKAYLELPDHSRRETTPHHVRICAMLHEIKSCRSVAQLGSRITGLIHLTYEVERRRCPGDQEVELSYADLLAQAVENEEGVYNEVWVRVMMLASGGVPVGARVLLEDGNVGIVVGPGEANDPLRPQVLVGERVYSPRVPVKLVSSAS